MNKLQKLNKDYAILRTKRLKTTPYDNRLLPKLKEMEREIERLTFIDKQIKLMPCEELLRHAKVSIDNHCNDYDSPEPCFCCQCLAQYRQRKKQEV